MTLERVHEARIRYGGSANAQTTAEIPIFAMDTMWLCQMAKWTREIGILQMNDIKRW